MAIPTRLALGLSTLIVGGFAIYVQVTAPPADQPLPEVTFAAPLQSLPPSSSDEDDAAPAAANCAIGRPTPHLASAGG